MWLVLAIGCSGNDDGSTHSAVTVPTGDTGPLDNTVTDLFEQDLVNEVDILWMVDSDWDAGNNALGPGIDRIDETLLLNDVDWRMGVLDTTASGADWGVIGAKWQSWPTPGNVFRFGPSGPGSRVRQTLFTTFGVKKDHPENEDFLRSSADLYVLVVTDRRDESSAGGVSDAQWNEWFTTLEPSEQKRMGVVTVAAEEKYWKKLAVDADVRYGAGLDKIYDDMILDAIHLKTTFQLSQVPLKPPKKVEVIYRDHATVYRLDRDYTWDTETNSFTFRTVRPPDTSIIRVTYDVGTGETLTGTGTTETTTP
ncbi:MAG: hypothetical protein H6738_08965 [Alphaproteobacteria bacterium]|nr:hypothetical protein [Alphaproteobacteria bacterium]